MINEFSFSFNTRYNRALAGKESSTKTPPVLKEKVKYESAPNINPTGYSLGERSFQKTKNES
jgi:hypothetical protein